MHIDFIDQYNTTAFNWRVNTHMRIELDAAVGDIGSKRDDAANPVTELADLQRAVKWMFQNKIGKFAAIGQISPASLRRENGIHCVLDSQNRMCEFVFHINAELSAFNITYLLFAIAAKYSRVPFGEVFIA